MSNTVTIAGVQSARIYYKDRPVCTTQQLAQFYSCTEKNISDNYTNNRNRFEEGKHFIFLDGEALKLFKQGIPDEIGDPLKFTARLILWTELGSARHAKMLTTDKAWDVYEEMEEAYFQRKETAALEQSTKPERVSIRYREAAAITRDQLKICKLLGVDDGMAKAIAAKEVKSVTGLDFTPLLTNATATENPRKTPKELAELIGGGATSEQVNSALERLCFQSKERWSNSKGQPRSKWVLTDLGKKYGALAPYQAEEHHHSGCRPVWYASVIELIQPLVAVAIVQRKAPKRGNKPAAAVSQAHTQPQVALL